MQMGFQRKRFGLTNLHMYFIAKNHMYNQCIYIINVYTKAASHPRKVAEDTRTNVANRTSHTSLNLNLNTDIILCFCNVNYC